MLKVNSSNFDVLNRYILNDETTTCGLCGAITVFYEINNVTQLHEFLNSGCGYKFITEEDDKFLTHVD